MKYHLAKDTVLKWLETPSVYQIAKDELYELDNSSFSFLHTCAEEPGCTSSDSAFIEYCLDEGLITTEKTAVPRPALKKSPAPSLRYLELQITNACNLRCKHCYLGDEAPAELSVEQIGRVLTEFEELQGLRLLISGGEPLLHKHFREINKALADVMVRKVLFTNGLLLTNELLKGLNVHEIQVSIDGLEQAHDSLRGPGTFRKAMDAAQRALDAGFDVSIATMVHAGNLRDFDAMERTFKELKIKDWTVDVPCEAGRLAQHREFHLTPGEAGKYLGYGYGQGLHGAEKGFGCGLHLMAVLADGKAAKCTFYGDRPVGRIEEGLRACWERVRPVRLESLACDCEYVEACRGGCRYRAELMEGVGGKDFYRCALYGIL